MDFATISVADDAAEPATSIIAGYDKSNNANKTNRKNKNIFTGPLIALVLSIIMMLLLAVAFSDYR
jgi:hypothetical protein